MQTPEDPIEIKLKKQRLRQFAVKQRHLQPHKSVLSQVICASLTTLPEYAEAETICSYVGVGDEVLTTNLVKTALEQGKRLVVPYVQHRRLALCRIRQWTDLEPAPFGLLEPSPELRKQPGMDIDPAEVQCYLVPGLAFGINGERLGHGKGYYDGLLRKTAAHAHKIGLCFACQIVKDLPMAEDDVYVDKILTDKGIFYSNQYL